MTDFERDTERRITNLESNVNNLIAEFRDFKTEMRDRDNHRATEIREIRQDMKNMQTRLDAKIDNIGNHIRNLSVATIIGVATIAITVVYSIFTR